MPAQVRHLIDRAMRIALVERTVTALIFPNDLQELPYEEPPRAHGTLHSGVGYAAPQDRALRGRPAARRRGPQRRQEGRDAGRRGRAAATDEVIAVADKLGAGVAKALLGKAALPDDLPWVTGSIGLLGTEPSYEMMKDATRC